MRKLNPIKAVLHALTSVLAYRAIAVRFGIFWIPVMFVLGVAEHYTLPPQPTDTISGPAIAVQLLSGVVGLIGFCSMAVSWHRFILRDEVSPPLRVDSIVWRYLGNSLLIMLIVLVPMIVLLGGAAGLASGAAAPVLSPLVSGLFLLLSLLMGTIAMRLSIKLPAVAVGRNDFTFRDAWQASDGNFWRIAMVFALNGLLLLAAWAAFLLIMHLAASLAAPLAPFVALILGAVFQLFYTMFNAGIFTSLYGFFVERRDY